MTKLELLVWFDKRLRLIREQMVSATALDMIDSLIVDTNDKIARLEPLVRWGVPND